MSEKSIILSTPMVQAILDGRKTQTRIPIKPKHDPKTFVSFQLLVEHEVKHLCKPPYQPGDILWVRETYGIEQLAGGSSINGAPADPRYIYKATDDIPDPCEYSFSSWHPSIHMPRAAARIFLRVKDVRVERIQDITPKDCWLEGIECRPYNRATNLTEKMAENWLIFDYHELWDSLNAKRGFSWDTNPWVWKISFERVNDYEPS